jgi:stage V sporulation protein D (sporulation-specific penicillin-binding protein)
LVQAPSNKMRLRMFIVMLAITVGIGSVLVYQLFNIQFVNGEEYQRSAVQQQMRSLKLTPSRGEIQDTNGKILAVSATVWNVIVDPVVVSKKEVNGQTEADIIAENLAPILEMDAAVIKEKCLTPNTRSVFIKKRIEKPQQEAVNQFLTDHPSIRSVYMLEDTKRYYPYGSLASTVIGFVNDENMGGAGIESQYNKVLSGTPGMVVTAKTAKETDMDTRYQQRYEPENGHSLILTLDETIQHFLEKHIENAVNEHEVRNRAVGIVMDVNTGAILGMTTKPDFDPNNFKEISDPVAKERLSLVAIASGGTNTEAYREALSNEQNLQWRNKAVSDPYEPGSVFKVITASAALDSGAASLNNYYDCYGSITVKDREIGCWKLYGHGNQSFAQTLQHSCNPAFVQIGFSIGGGTFYDYFDTFGLTQGTGIDLPGEAGSIYHPRERLETSLVSLASCSFGQTFKVTPIQMITAISTAVNGGNLVTPYLVKQVIDENGSVVEAHEPVIRRQVISEQTSQTIAELMETVVSAPDGSGRNAYLAGYRVGGKTGTSQKLDQALTEDGREEHVLSFVGVAPMDDPQIAVLVILDSPKLDNVLSSTIAVPVGKYILEDILSYIGVEPKYTAEEMKNLDLTTPNTIGLELQKAKDTLEELGLGVKVIGQGEAVLKQVPTPSTQIPRDATILLYTDEDITPNLVEVPDVFGLGTSVVNQMLTNAGLNLSFTGGLGRENSVASRQTPEAGTMVEAGTVVTVELTALDTAGVY